MRRSLRAILEILFGSLQDMPKLVRHMWRSLLVALIAIGIALFIGRIVAPSTTLGKAVADVVATVVGLWLAAPYLVSLYRYLLLDEVVRWPESIRLTAASRLFFGWSGAFVFLAALPDLALILVDGPNGIPEPEGTVITIGSIIALIYVGVRAMTLLPAAALGGPATLRQAFSETRGRFWFIFISSCLPFVVVWLSAAGASWLARTLGGVTGMLIIGIPVLLAAALVGALATVTVTVRLYKVLVRGDGGRA